MHKFYLYTLWGFSVLVGIMPLFVWRALSALLYFVIYVLVGYRVKMVRYNLTNSFPEKSQKELRQIERKFYLYLADIFVETLAIAGLSKRRISKLMTFETSEEFEADTAKGSVIVAMAHYASWEWPSIYALQTNSKLIPVYHKLSSKVAEDYFLKLRRKFGAEPVPMSSVGRRLVQAKDENIILALIADQFPPYYTTGGWTMFLNQDTKFFTGVELLSKRYSMPVYYFDIKQTSRNHYSGKFVKLYDGITPTEPYEVVDRYKDYLQQRIFETPHLWMWSHNRWKQRKAKQV